MVLTCSDARTIALRMGWGWDRAQEEAQMEDSPLVYYPTWRSLPWPPAICDDLLFRGIELDCREWQSAVKQLQPRDGSRSSNQEACYLLAIKEGKRDVEGKQPMGFNHGFQNLRVSSKWFRLFLQRLLFSEVFSVSRRQDSNGWWRQNVIIIVKSLFV